MQSNPERARFSGGGRFFGRANRVEKAEELIHMGYLEGVVDPVADADQSETPAFLLMSDVSAHESADSGGIHVRDVREVENQGARLIAAHKFLEVEKSSQQKGPVKAQDSLAGLGSGRILDAKGVVGHSGMLLLERRRIVKAMLILVSRIRPQRLKPDRFAAIYGTTGSRALPKPAGVKARLKFVAFANPTRIGVFQQPARGRALVRGVWLESR
jgi:hypothetical protein